MKETETVYKKVGRKYVPLAVVISERAMQAVMEYRP